MITEKDTEEIERYLSGELDADERKAFEVKIKENPKLRKELALHQNLRNAVNDTDAVELETSLKKVRSAWEKENESNARNRFWTAPTFKIAAAVTLLGIVSFLIYDKNHLLG